MHWSPQGKHIVLAGLKGLNGQLEFFSVDDMETMAAAEHFMATDVDWDPTGACLLLFRCVCVCKCVFVCDLGCQCLVGYGMGLVPL